MENGIIQSNHEIEHFEVIYFIFYQALRLVISLFS